MGYDTFCKKDKKIKVHMYDGIAGGLVRDFNIGDKIPIEILDYHFSISNPYGMNYNIFPYETTEYVILIRNGIFVDMVHYNDLLDEFVFKVRCFNQFGMELNLKCIKDYADLKT